MQRRPLLQALALSPLASAFTTSAQTRQQGRPAAGYGPLRPVADQATGLPLLMLPEGFSYRSFGWAGEALANGGVVPGAADGMGIVKTAGEVFTLVRNHELMGVGGGFGPAASQYDAGCDGGTVTLRYDRAAGKLLEMRGSLSGTLVNCAGGTTPWGSWLSCEEIVTPAGHTGQLRGQPFRLEKPHGFVFEVPADGVSKAQALTALGQFRHEAALVDADGTVYLTEDARPAGFYRLLPARKGDLAAGGRLQMLSARGASDLRTGLKAGQQFDVSWVDIDRPADGVGDNGNNGVLLQGRARGGSLFTRLEGLDAGRDEIFFTSTDGGDAKAGQVWRFVPSQQRLELFLESPAASVFDYPDNLCLHPRQGLIVVCEDSKQPVQRLYGLKREAGLEGLFELARNNVQLAGGELQAQPVLKGDFRGAEWAGTCFSADGKTLFANVYRPGFTVAISGPF
ncbi:alkaline phosphatase PhoX [Roseateles sp. LYH14W]|uniref:Alkaline phosphatase PhoX n=1 Tax=Pelomonas parva TaxID=3299032 RepID=A0ABW7FAM2_9BURK